MSTETPNKDGYIGAITNAPKSHSKQSKKCSMENHFNYFVKHYWRQTGVTTFAELTPQNLSVELVDNFVNYLASLARKNCKPDGELLAFGSVDQYLSSFKTNLVEKFFHENTNLIVNNSEKMSLLRKRMLEKKIQLCREEGKQIMSSLEAASDEDIDTFFLLCFLEGTEESAEFLHLMMSCIANCGRGSEVRSNFYKFNQIEQNLIHIGFKLYQIILTFLK